MRDKLNQFIDNLNGQFVEVSSKEAIYQCMDLSYLWVFCLNFPKSTIQHQYAYQVYTDASDFTRQYFDIIQNKLEIIPEVGDLVVWNKTSGNVAGHIALLIEATITKMKVFEQNSPLGTNAHISDKSYANVLGFLRPKNVIIDGVAQWLTTLLQERNLTIQDEGKIREIFGKAKDYDDKVKELSEQVKSANETLSSKAAEVSLLVDKVTNLENKVAELEEQFNQTRSERDTALWEGDKLKIENTRLVEENEAFKEENNLFAYSWFTRLFSLLKRR